VSLANNLSFKNVQWALTLWLCLSSRKSQPESVHALCPKPLASITMKRTSHKAMSPLFQYHQLAPFPDSSISIMNLDWHLHLFKELLVISIYMLIIWWILRESPISTFYTSGQLTIILNGKEQKHLVFCTRENRKVQVLSNKFRDSNMLEHLIEQYHTRAFIYSFFLGNSGENFFSHLLKWGQPHCTMHPLRAFIYSFYLYHL
jgi:hypothetical protein